jgi:indolepyruvate decarboxylase
MGFLPLKVGNKRVVLATSEETRIRNSYYKDIVFSDFMRALFEANICSRSTMMTTQAAQSIFVPQKKAITVGRFFEKINSVLTSNTAIIADIGESLFGAVDLVMRGASSFFSPAFYTSMGFALPGCLGYMTAQPKGRPFVFVGDGAFQMTGMEISTLARRKLSPVIFVLNNKGYATERMLLDGPWNDVQGWNYHLIPQVINGGKGYVVSTEEELDETLKEVLSENYLSIINVKFDKNDRSPAMNRFAQKFKKRL